MSSYKQIGSVFFYPHRLVFGFFGINIHETGRQCIHQNIQSLPDTIDGSQTIVPLIIHFKMF